MKKKNFITVIIAVIVVVSGILFTQLWLKSNREKRAEEISQSQTESTSTPSSVPQFVESSDTSSNTTEQPVSQTDTTEIPNSDGSITADREWNKKVDDGNIAGDDANLAGGGGEIELDENGVYHGEPAPAPAPQKPAPAPAPVPDVLPGFENAIQGGPTIMEESHDVGGDWNKIVGTM